MTNRLDKMYKIYLLSRQSITIAPPNYELPDYLQMQTEEIPEQLEADDTSQQQNLFNFPDDYDLRYLRRWDDFPQARRSRDSYSYLIDFDRDVFTINLTLHIPLDLIPYFWASFVATGVNRHTLVWSDGLSPRYIATPHTLSPKINTNLVARYHRANPAVIDSWKPQTKLERLKFASLLEYQGNFLYNLEALFTQVYDCAGVDSDIMQKLVYLFIHSSYLPAHDFLEAKWPSMSPGFPQASLHHILQNLDYPRSPIYYIPVGKNKVLISLATHLNNEGILTMEVGRVIGLAEDLPSVTSACILSLEHVVIVRINRLEEGTVAVSHTPAIEIRGSENGRLALASILSPREARSSQDCVLNSTKLPTEIIETIIRYVLLNSGRSKNISSLVQTCRLFKAIVDAHAVRLPGRTYLTLPTEDSEYFYKIEESARQDCFERVLCCFST